MDWKEKSLHERENMISSAINEIEEIKKLLKLRINTKDI